MAFRVALAVLVAAAILSPSLAGGEEDLQLIINCLQAKGQHSTFLRHLKQSGFQSVLGRYLGKKAITLLAPTDAAWKDLPSRLKGRLIGKDRIEVIEFHLLRELWPYAAIKKMQKTGRFNTALGGTTEFLETGPFIYLCDVGSADTICLSSEEDATPDSIAIITKGDYCELSTRTVAVQSINSVMIPPGLWDLDTA